MSVTLTENAVREIRRVMSEQNLPEETLLRVGVSGGGCSGFEYRLGFEEGEVDACASEARSKPAQIVTPFGVLNLDDLGPGLGENQGGHGTGQQGAEVDDSDAFEWLHGSVVS